MVGMDRKGLGGGDKMRNARDKEIQKTLGKAQKKKRRRHRGLGNLNRGNWNGGGGGRVGGGRGIGLRYLGEQGGHFCQKNI